MLTEDEIDRIKEERRGTLSEMSQEELVDRLVELETELYECQYNLSGEFGSRTQVDAVDDAFENGTL